MRLLLWCLPTYIKGGRHGCEEEHSTGDRFTCDCVKEKKLRFYGECKNFPCDTIMAKPHATSFFVYDKATKQVIGIAGLKEMKPNVYTVTDIALSPDFHGKGYGKQILTAFLSFAFDELGAIELHYDCFRQNEESKHLALSCGFTYTHSEEAELTKDGEKVILDYYEVRK